MAAERLTSEQVRSVFSLQSYSYNSIASVSYSILPRLIECQLFALIFGYGDAIRPVLPGLTALTCFAYTALPYFFLTEYLAHQKRVGSDSWFFGKEKVIGAICTILTIINTLTTVAALLLPQLGGMTSAFSISNDVWFYALCALYPLIWQVKQYLSYIDTNKCKIRNMAIWQLNARLFKVELYKKSLYVYKGLALLCFFLEGLSILFLAKAEFNNAHISSTILFAISIFMRLYHDIEHLTGLDLSTDFDVKAVKLLAKTLPESQSRRLLNDWRHQNKQLKWIWPFNLLALVIVISSGITPYFLEGYGLASSITLVTVAILTHHFNLSSHNSMVNAYWAMQEQFKIDDSLVQISQEMMAKFLDSAVDDDVTAENLMIITSTLTRQIQGEQPHLSPIDLENEVSWRLVRMRKVVKQAGSWSIFHNPELNPSGAYQLLGLEREAHDQEDYLSCCMEVDSD